MESINLTNTLAGLAAIQRAMAGEDILFTRLEIGDGVLINTDVSGLTGLINKTKEYVLGAVKAEDSEIVRLRSNISNAGVTQDLIIREYGIYAKFGNEQEFLFAYLNVGDLTTPLPNERIGRYELNRDFVLYIGNSTHVDFTSNGHLIYLDLKTFKIEKEGINLKFDDTSKEFEKVKKDIVISRTESISLGRIEDNSLPASKLKISTDKDRIQPENLGEKVISMMTGQTPVGPTIDDNSITSEKVAKGAITYKKTDFIKEGEYFENFYNPLNSQLGGLTPTGADDTDERYSRTDYIELSGTEIIIKENKGILTSLYAFLYTEDKTQAIRVTEWEQIINQGSIIYKIKIPEGYKYFRMVDISVSSGSYKETLEIFVETSMNAHLLKSENLNKYFAKDKDLNVATKTQVEKYKPLNSQPGGLQPDGTDGVTEGYFRTDYIEVIENTTLIITAENLMVLFGFLYIEKNRPGIKIQDITPVQQDGTKYTFKIPEGYKYFRMVDVSPVNGSYKETLTITEINVDKPTFIIKGIDLEDYFVQKKNMNVTPQTQIEKYKPSNSQLGGLGPDGTDGSVEGFSRTDYIEVIENTTLIVRAENLMVLFGFLYTEKNKSGIKVQDITSVQQDGTKYTFKIPEGYKYFRMVDISATYGSYKETLTITEINVDKPTFVINGIDLEGHFATKKDLENFEPGAGGGTDGNSNKLPRPSNGIVNFKYKLNVNLDHTGESTLAPIENIVEFEDWGVLFLPKNYSQNGNPIRLVIACHGAGTHITSTTTTLTNPIQHLVNCLGYAVLDVNGIPSALAQNSGLHYGSPIALQSYIKGYNYVIEKYNLKTDGVFVTGTSMGGLTSFMLVQSGSIPVIAQAGFCPVVDHFKQAYCRPWSGGIRQRSDIAKFFNFDNFESFNSWTDSRVPSQAEVDYYLQNLNKVIGYNPMLKNTNFKLAKIYDFLPGVSGEKEAYDQLVKYHNVPLKVWHNENDGTVDIKYSEYLVNAIRNNGGLAYLRKFPTGDHNAWDNGDVVDYKDFDGLPYRLKVSGFEVCEWFKRFDI